MQKYTGRDLIELGFTPGPDFKKMLEAANRLDCSRENLFAELIALFPPAPPKVEMRNSSAPLYVALDATTEAEKSNKDKVISAMTELLKVPVILRGSVMPDACPAGSAPCTIPVGGVIEVDNAIIPGAHSADICCSMYATFYKSNIANLSVHLDKLRGVTRFGVGGRKKSGWVHHRVLNEDVWSNSFLKGLEEYAAKHMADQGDGNHFAYIGTVKCTAELLSALNTEDANLLQLGETYNVLVTHHGSRGLGAQVYKRGLQAAINHTAKVAKDIPDAAAWIDATSDDGKAYWEALEYVERWTIANHESIHNAFIAAMRGHSFGKLYNAHNFVWRDGNSFFHGKGSTPAKKGVIGLIPLNMSQPILIVTGKGNNNALNFAPHGAGRNLSRSELVKSLGDKVQENYENAVNGIDVRWYSGTPDISETSIAYKNADEVRAQIAKYELADVVATIEPYGCIMAGHFDKPWKKPKRK